MDAKLTAYKHLSTLAKSIPTASFDSFLQKGFLEPFNPRQPAESGRDDSAVPILQAAALRGLIETLKPSQLPEHTSSSLFDVLKAVFSRLPAEPVTISQMMMSVR